MLLKIHIRLQLPSSRQWMGCFLVGKQLQPRKARVPVITSDCMMFCEHYAGEVSLGFSPWVGTHTAAPLQPLECWQNTPLVCTLLASPADPGTPVGLHRCLPLQIILQAHGCNHCPPLSTLSTGHCKRADCRCKLSQSNGCH